jgi:phosphatidate cytidylyltransferase
MTSWLQPQHATWPVLAVLGGVFALLLAATFCLRLRGDTLADSNRRELAARIRSWWIMAGIFAAALLLSRTAFIIFFAFVSFLAFKEYLSLIPTRRADRRVLFWAYMAIPVQYYWISADWYGMFIIFIPVYMFLFLPFRMVLTGETKGFLKATGTLHWGLMTTVFALSHLAALLALPLKQDFTAGAAGLVLFLVLLTEFNDVMQYVWGKLLGRRKIIPAVSPGKTWAGFIGGVLSTALAGALLAPLLTPFSLPQGLLAGLAIGVAGFIGDVVVSAVKRDLGVKDSGSLIPGHGGVLDRLDSLLYTAPLFYHAVRYLHGA